jgi:hypothetical protein
MSVARIACLTLVAAMPLAAEEPAAIAVQSSREADVSVHYLNIPWGPNTFAQMERPEGTFYNKRTWPFARLETKRPLSLDGKTIPAGNYALVFHPNTEKDQGMSLEVLKIEVPEFLQAGNVMTRTPPGVQVFSAPVRFETVPSTTPTLKVSLVPADEGLTLNVEYGDRRLKQPLAY